MPALAEEQFQSLRRLAALPIDVRILPTHGAGSFCVSGPAGPERESTIGLERKRNPFLQVADSDAFLRLISERLGRYPAYYATWPISTAAGRCSADALSRRRS